MELRESEGSGVMGFWQTARHQVAIAGRVRDTETGKPLAGAVITVIAMPVAFRRKVELLSKSRAALTERVDRTRSRADGIFYFLDLPEGKYILAAAIPNGGRRYGTAQQTANVARDNKGNVKLTSIDFSLQPTVVKGKVTGTGHKSGVAMAEVRIKGSGERAFTDVQGEYVLTGIEPGKRNVVVLAQGYRTMTQPVALAEPGASETVNFNLVRESG